MTIRFLGTGAADWDITHPSRDPEFRRFCSALIDGVLLIDPGPCVYEFAGTFGYGAVLTDNIKYVINTHTHPDHYDQNTLDRLERAGAVFVPLAAGETKEVGGYSVTALAANHATADKPVHFMVSRGGSTLFYGLDGAWLTYAEWRAIAETKPDLAVLDATIGDITGDYRIFEHNDLRMVEELAAALHPYCGRIMISHMARTLHTSHAALIERMSATGITPAHDDMCVTV